mgnify:CR=1 FL=1
MTNELAIWWLDEKAIDLVIALEPVLPEYVWGELHSMHGRPKRGRLWVAEQFGDVNIDWPDSELLRLLEEKSGGIVVAREDVAALAFLPGFVTDAKMARVTPSLPAYSAVVRLVKACRPLFKDDGIADFLELSDALAAVEKEMQ